MKNAFSIFGLIALSSLVSSSSFSCEQNDLIGNWIYVEKDSKIPDQSTTILLNFEPSSLKMTTQLGDDLTATQSYGPYFESTSIYNTTFYSKECAVRGETNLFLLNTIRKYAEPLFLNQISQVSSHHLLEASLKISKDKKTLKFTTDKKKSLIFKRHK